MGYTFSDKGTAKSSISEALRLNKFFSEGVRTPHQWEGRGGLTGMTPKRDLSALFVLTLIRFSKISFA